MASFKVGARGEGVVSSVLDLVQRRQGAYRDRADELRKFNQRLMEIGIEVGLKSGEIDPLTFERREIPESFYDRNLSPREGLFQDVRASQQALQKARGLTDADFLQQATSTARSQITERLPRTPFVPGPEGGFITGRSVEAAPTGLISRPEVAGSLAQSVAPQLATQLRQRGVEGAQQRFSKLQEEIKALQGSGLLTGGETAETLTDTQQFRQDIQDAVAAVQTGKITRKEAMQRIRRRWPDKLNIVDEIERRLF